MNYFYRYEGVEIAGRDKLSWFLPAGFLHDFSSIVSADFTKRFIAIDNGKVDYLSVGQQEGTVSWKLMEEEKRKRSLWKLLHHSSIFKSSHVSYILITSIFSFELRTEQWVESCYLDLVHEVSYKQQTASFLLAVLWNHLRHNYLKEVSKHLPGSVLKNFFQFILLFAI